jgi:hypothetical protein
MPLALDFQTTAMVKSAELNRMGVFPRKFLFLVAYDQSTGLIFCNTSID